MRTSRQMAASMPPILDATFGNDKSEQMKQQRQEQAVADPTMASAIRFGRTQWRRQLATLCRHAIPT